MRRKKTRATTRPDAEINSIGVLYGHGYLDAGQYDTLGTIVLWLERLARGWGGVGGCTGLWYAILGAATPTGFVRPQNDVTSGLADGARRQLARSLRALDGSRNLVLELASGAVPPLVWHVLEGRLSAADEAELGRLRDGLDRLSGRR